MKKIIGILLLFISIQGLSQGKLDRSKEEINKGRSSGTSTSSSNNNTSSSTRSHVRCDDDKTLGQMIGETIGKIIFYTTYYTTVGDYKTENHLHSRVTKYPYYNNHSGNYEKPDSGLYSKNCFRVDADYQFIYSNKDLAGNHFKLNIRPFQYFYLQAQYHQLSEKNIDHTKSNLYLYNFNLCYDRLRFEKFNLGWKVGMCYISNNVNAGGFSAGLDAEAFVIKPFSIYLSKQWGEIHNVPVNEFEIGTKYYMKRYNIHLGYEHLKMGTPLYDYIFLGAGIHL